MDTLAKLTHHSVSARSTESRLPPTNATPSPMEPPAEDEILPRPALDRQKRSSDSVLHTKRPRLVRSDSMLPNSLGKRRTIQKSMSTPPSQRRVTFVDRPASQTHSLVDVQSEPGSFGSTRRTHIRNAKDLENLLPARLSWEGFDRGRSLYVDYNDYDAYAPPNSINSASSLFRYQSPAAQVPMATENILPVPYFETAEQKEASQKSSLMSQNRSESSSPTHCCLSGEWLSNLLHCRYLKTKRKDSPKFELKRRWSADRKRPEREVAPRDRLREARRQSKASNRKKQNRWTRFFGIVFI